MTPDPSPARPAWPRTLFGRNLLLIVSLILVAQLATGLILRQGVLVPRLLAAADATVQNVEALAHALAALPPAERAAFVERFNARGADAPGAATSADARQPPASSASTRLTRLERAMLVRIDRQLPATAAGPRWRRGPGDSLVLRVDVEGASYWIDLRGLLPANEPGTAWLWATAATALLAIAGAWWLQRRLGQPLAQLVDAARATARGGPPPRLPEDGPAEIATVSRAFNEMAADLARNARERDLMLAGLSHDLRTPLAKMQLAVEMIGPGADAPLRQSLRHAVDTIDRLVAQFVAFTRATQPTDEPAREIDLDGVVREALALCAPEGIAFLPGRAGTPTLRAQAVARMVLNLVGNAQRHGAPPVEVATGRRGVAAWLEVRDRGPGIPPARVDSLKAPFARGDEARGAPDGGAGLGLAIVERLARGEGATFELLPREGGGLVARVVFAAEAPAGAAS
jgi:two-component system osmolarity sensor histidine kinase EnvZ